jgi:tRNA G18 (ribose-2'-O)-methylase SpoU
MTAEFYEIRQCPNCGLRYPLTAEHSFGERCPSCLGETQVVLKREFAHPPHREDAIRAGENSFILLDNIRSIWNVGSIFRTADGLGIKKLYLCGITPTPENETIRKTSLGAEKHVAWEYSRNALKTAKTLSGEGCVLVALEQDPRAVPISKFTIPYSQTPILILGNEVTGVDPELLDLSDHIVQIPMHGQKSSFNVEVAFAIAAYTLISKMDITGK